MKLAVLFSHGHRKILLSHQGKVCEPIYIWAYTMHIYTTLIREWGSFSILVCCLGLLPVVTENLPSARLDSACCRWQSYWRKWWQLQGCSSHKSLDCLDCRPSNCGASFGDIQEEWWPRCEWPPRQGWTESETCKRGAWLGAKTERTINFRQQAGRNSPAALCYGFCR